MNNINKKIMLSLPIIATSMAILSYSFNGGVVNWLESVQDGLKLLPIFLLAFIIYILWFFNIQYNKLKNQIDLLTRIVLAGEVERLYNKLNEKHFLSQDDHDEVYKLKDLCEQCGVNGRNESLLARLSEKEIR